MKRLLSYSCLLLLLALGTNSCQNEIQLPPDIVPQEVMDKITRMGLNPDGIVRIERGYLVERDIVITDELLNSTPVGHRVPGQEQYRTTNLVNTGGSRVITISTNFKGKNAGFMDAAVDIAIARYNAQGLTLTFERATAPKGNKPGSVGIDITLSSIAKNDPNYGTGVLGYAGFPTDGGDPYNEVKLGDILASYSMNFAASVITHELGHCIGFRHTDYYDRSISCNGTPSNEGDAGIGAIPIPGTPTTATKDAKSWMLSCADGSDRPFNADDIIALNCLYQNATPCQ